MKVYLKEYYVLGMPNEFVEPLDLAKRLRTKICTPVDILRKVKCMITPLSINRSDVREIQRLSNYLYLISTRNKIFVSLVFNMDMADQLIDFKTIIIHKVYEGIYYHVDVCL
ncbi:hypothetical protein HK407_11g16570 [Ordospora pajunii]|uniref:uncharacterized protein n=1 Tax=Ordospora pajunii TaxID=3039483 RepID=UPI0029526C91|nr:uncharacterized protein HK407_11g16570 [Ordospora pajunii]KAH9410763.1 hypothetical protein HK407_11g16570 [Ordospora pajunii]